MDYEKKYKEALEKARAYDRALAKAKEQAIDGYLDAVAVNDIFPELKESEDERIRKALVGHLKECRNNTRSEVMIGEYGKWIAWLEKQGEMKPLPSDYDKAFDEFLSHIPEKDPESSNSLYTYEDLESAIQFGIKWQKEQKPAWSEDDETTKNNISHIIRQYDKISKKENQPCWYIGDCLLWMQNIKDRVQPQPKQEWSEEDERVLNATINTVLISRNSCEEDDEVKDRYDDELRWLKSLRPQWKPSDEQMKALDDVISSRDIKYDVLSELWKDLKKLMGE